MKIHVVKAGESLRDIARRYSREPKLLREANELVSGAKLCPGQSLVIPGLSPSTLGSMEIMAFSSPPFSAVRLYESFEFLTYFCPYASGFSPGAELFALNTTELYDRAEACGTALMLCLSNRSAAGGFSSRLAHDILSDSSTRTRLISSVADELQQGGYYGLHLGFNYLFPFDRDNYTGFVAELAEKLHREGRILSLELAPIESGSSALSSGFDYAALGELADRVCLMSCRWGHSQSPPQPLSPMPGLRAALYKALEQIPAEKLLMGLSGIGFDWALPWHQGDVSRPIYNAAAIEKAMALGLEIVYDEKTQTPHYDYTDPAHRRHRVYFEDVRSVAAKLGLVDELGLAGLALYSWDRPSKPILRTIESLYSAEKLI